MSECVFCNAILTPSNRAKEHVLKKSWISTLCHESTLVNTVFSSQNGLIDRRIQPAISILAGDICCKCNNGWMNDLDMIVEEVILSSSKQPLRILQLNSLEIYNISRWILKTACAYEAINSKSRRHIPQKILNNVHRNGYLPDGFVLFARLLKPNTRGIHAILSDIWEMNSQHHKFKTMDQSNRFKFAIQYDSIILGCAYLNSLDPMFSGVVGVHIPIMAKKASINSRKETYVAVLPDGHAYSEINLFLATMNVYF